MIFLLMPFNINDQKRIQTKKEMKVRKTYKPGLDKIGITVALVCMLHCILLPVLLTTLPYVEYAFLENLYIELATIGLALLVGGWAVWTGYRRYHYNGFILLLFILGIALMAGAGFLKKEIYEMAGKGLAAMLVITAHVLNWKAGCRCFAGLADKKS
jgi:hypothetical protein